MSRFAIAISLVMAYVLPVRGELSSCKFNFGMAWDGPNAGYPQELDYITIWAGSDENFNPYWIGDMLKACKPGGKLEGRTPVYYSYIIAFTARSDRGLKDCDVGSPNLCEGGAKYIRQEKARILSQYEKYASETAKIWGKLEPIVWLMEPDFYQYASGTKQEGGPLTFAEAAALMGELVAIVRKHLPQANFSMDISPWVPNPSAWYGAFNMGDFTYNHTSGGRTEADNARIRAVNPMTWKSVYELTKKPIIADDGYGVAGSLTGHDATWDNPSNLQARIGDGVIAITQANPKSDWNGTIANIRGQLPSLPGCPTSNILRERIQPFLTVTPDLLRGRNVLGRDLGKPSLLQ